MSDDHLDKELSVSFELTETGVEGRARSRAITAIDRLIGNVADAANAPLEAWIREKRARADAQAKLLSALRESAIEELKERPDYAKAIIKGYVERMFSRYQNKAAVVAAAIEDLRADPPTDEQSKSGGEALSEEFMSRFERFSEDATTDDLQEKWGKVLAAEVRKPGTVSKKVMRVVDELDKDTAELFDKLCAFRIRHIVPIVLSGELHFSDKARLVDAGLIVDPGFTGQQMTCSDVVTSNGDKIWALGLGGVTIAFPHDAVIPGSELKKVPVHKVSNVPGTPIYILTDVGMAITEILPDRFDENLAALASKMSSYLACDVSEYRIMADGQNGLARVYRGDNVIHGNPS